MNAYKPILRVLGILFIIVGLGAIAGGMFSHGYVTEQLSAQKIQMPAVEALKTDEQKAALEQYAGEMMTTGPQAEAFANQYINAHMEAMADGKRYQEVSGEFLALQKDPNADPAQVEELGQLRQTLFMGESLRGMLLNAYGWWMVGTIALGAGIALTASGVIGTALSFVGSKKAQA